MAVLAVLAPLLWFPASSVELWRLLAVCPVFPLGCFARFLCGSFAAALPGVVYGPLLAFILFCGFFFACGGFCRSVAVLNVGSGSAFGRGYSVKFCPVAVPGFGYSLPVVFSGSFWDPLRLLLLSWFNNSRRRASFPVAVLRVGCGFYWFGCFRAFCAPSVRLFGYDKKPAPAVDPLRAVLLCCAVSFV